MSKEETPTEVAPLEHKHEGANLRGSLKAELCVWTERMLAALKSGVKGGKWFSLNDKCIAKRTLLKAWKQVKGNGGCGGIDGVNLATFEEHLDKEIDTLHEQLKEGSYRTQPVRRVWIPKLGGCEKRPLGIPTVRDRIVQAAVAMTLGPIFEIGFEEQSYGFRPKRGAKDALRRVARLLKDGYEWVVDVDIRKYFDTIDHGILMKRVREKIGDGKMLSLIESFLKQGVMESHKGWKPTPSGTPQGAIISPLLSNIYLDDLDKEMRMEGLEMIRYADDFVVMCKTEEEANEVLGMIRDWTELNKLELHPDKTRIVHHNDPGGFQFLGYRFEKGRRFVRKESLKKLKDKIRERTSRTNGESMEEVIKSLNPTLKGWSGYFKHSHNNVHMSLDGWIRMRLRSIYRKRNHKKGRGRGSDHHRWPNAHFAGLGLFSLEQARALACRS
jgi:RNA-directed DNA polymerase